MPCPEIDRLLARCQQTPFDVIIGIGGGKTLDTAKSVAFYQKVPVVIVPTIASTDAPTSALAVIYTPEGQFSEYLMIPTNPNMVIMDTGVVARAPVRLLVSGMGMRSPPTSRRAPTRCPVARPWPVVPPPWRRRPSPNSATRPCWLTATRPSGGAGACTKAVENIIEANTYLSGIGFESSGLAAAHAVHNGLTQLAECHHLYHGEKVAFGTLAAGAGECPMAEIETVLGFCRSVGLPTNLHMMGVKELDMARPMDVAKASTAEGETIHNMPFKVTAEDVLAAIVTAHQLGL